VLVCASGALSATPALADDAAATPFTLAPAYGPVGQTVTLTAQGQMTFPTDGSASVTFTNGVLASQIDAVSATELTAVVPAGAVTGPVSVIAGQTTYAGPTFTLQQPTALSGSVSPALVTIAHRATVTGVLTSTGATPGPVAGATATLQQRTASGAAWHLASGTAPQTTAANGSLRWVVRPSRNGEYRIDFQQTPEYAASDSPALRVSVQPRIVVHRTELVPAFTATRIRGAVRPALAGPVELDQQQHGRWLRVARQRVRHGSFSFAIQPTSYALLRYRVLRPADPAHVAAVSPELRIRVVHRQLQYGDSGPDVRALQQRLRALHYDVGPASSSYGWDMVHAVTAFQKVQGFAPNGVTGPSVWSRLSHPKQPHLRYPTSSGLSVEVDLSREILMLGRSGKVWRILDTSTGGGYTYTDSAGEQATAVTPTGHFTIESKFDGLVKDKLGTLWRPSYFTSGGDAIHGEGDSNYGGDVPPYPASHGCVRITDLAVDRYYNILVIGTPVSIYR
jgi:lipoprotein-anchoring transpeptidase ErfK/SrfK